MGHQHRRFEPRTDNRRNETRDTVNESTTSVHRSILQHLDTRTTQQDYQVKMGPSTEGQRSPSTDCSQRRHRRCQRQRRHLCINTNFLCTETPANNVTIQQMDCESRRHLNSFSTRQSSNKWSVYVSTNRVLQSGRPSSMEAQQSHLRSP